MHNLRARVNWRTKYSKILSPFFGRPSLPECERLIFLCKFGDLGEFGLEYDFGDVDIFKGAREKGSAVSETEAEAEAEAETGRNCS